MTAADTIHSKKSEDNEMTQITVNAAGDNSGAVNATGNVSFHTGKILCR